MRDILIFENPWLLLPLLVLFVMVHGAKSMRLYLIVIDEKIPFARFLLLYCVTTLVNLIVPFKLGEFFRIFVFTKATKSFRVGFLSVLLDRFFDTVALVLILLPFELLKGGTVSDSTLLLAAFVVVSVFAYVSFLSFYTYLNRYLIMNRTSGGAMMSLRFLELMRAGYNYVRRLIHGRYALLVIFSFVAWLLECGILFLLSKASGLAGLDFSAYIQSIISTATTPLMSRYVKISILLMALFTVITLAVCLMKQSLFAKKSAPEKTI
ncbi:MAG: flippase-like domain-containing protein [Lachnospiraceae bacterium]|nr:flippase-like domain-containing protein [Lachnospiraceae bacterium]